MKLKKLDSKNEKGLLISFLTRNKILYPLIFIIIVASIIDHQFFSFQNFKGMTLAWSTIALMGIGMTFVIIGGGFDLSVGGTYACAAVLFPSLYNSIGLFPALLFTLLAGVFIGIVNGLIITGLDVNPFVATLGMGFALRGIALASTNAAPILVTGKSFGILGSGLFLGLPIPGILALVAFVIAGLVLAKTIFGRNVFAVGGSSESARLSGINIVRVRILTYAISGCMASAAGMIISSRLMAGAADIGANIELQVITVVVVGGTALMGGLGSVWFTAAGVALLAVLQNAFDRLQINPFWQQIVTGLIIIAAVSADSRSRRKKQMR